MDSRLLDYYNRELSYLRELGAEFSREYPKVAGRLGMNGVEVADPYVERLLEGFGFLTARIQMKMDAEFPRLSQHLLEVLHPNYLAPLPSMLIAQFEPSMNEGSLARGFPLPRGTAIRGQISQHGQTACEYMTAHDLTLWPLRMAQAAFTGPPVDLPLNKWGVATGQAGVSQALRLELELCGGTSLEELSLDRLDLFLAGQDLPMLKLLEALTSHVHAIVVHEAASAPRWHHVLPAGMLAHEGFAPEQALLPTDGRSFHGYRLLQEYFAFPCRYRFVSLRGLAQVRQMRLAAGGETRRFAITILLSRAEPTLEGAIDTDHLALNCTPAINLFPRRADRLTVSDRFHEHHVVVDRSRPLDYEVFAVQKVMGHGRGMADRAFRPFYQSMGSDDGNYDAYFSVRREPRLISEHAQRQGPRSAYLGSEVFLALVDRQQAPYAPDLRHLSVDVLCTNRDLPLLFRPGLHTDFTLKVSAPVRAIRVLKGPSRPQPPLAEGAAAWRLVGHMGLGHLHLTDLDETQGAAALRQVLAVFGELADPVVRKQIQGVRHVRVQPVHRRMPIAGPLVYGRGIRLDVQVDEAAFSGQTPFLLGAVLERFLSRHVSINTFTEMQLSSLQNGVLAQWPARIGGRAIA